MKCQDIFSGGKIRKTVNLSSVGFFQRVVKINGAHMLYPRSNDKVLYIQDKTLHIQDKVQHVQDKVLHPR